MNKKLVFSFDIDTHKCIRDGVPNLVRLSDEENVRFCFFLNTGKSVSLKESIRQILKKKRKEKEVAEHMSAIQKLGKRDYLVAALLNPKVIWYKKQIRQLLNSRCEVGLHGGDNHALWEVYGSTYKKEQLEDELTKAINNIKKIDDRFCPLGFASPCWNTPDDLPGVLKELGFAYYRDHHGLGIDDISYEKEIPEAFVNLLGEPGGVAFFEYERVIGKSTEEIILDVDQALNRHEVTVIYDHPYYAGIKEVETLRKIIRHMKENDVEIVTFGEIL